MPHFGDLQNEAGGGVTLQSVIVSLVRNNFCFSLPALSWRFVILMYYRGVIGEIVLSRNYGA